MQFTHLCFWWQVIYLVKRDAPEAWIEGKKFVILQK